MKNILMVFAAMVISLFLCNYAQSDPMSHLIQQYGSDYEALVPPPNSSVRTDYKQEQIALGALYTTKAIGLLYQQNQLLIEKYDATLIKYDELIKQNKEIIRILTVIAAQEKPD